MPAERNDRKADFIFVADDAGSQHIIRLMVFAHAVVTERAGAYDITTGTKSMCRSDASSTQNNFS